MVSFTLLFYYKFQMKLCCSFTACSQSEFAHLQFQISNFKFNSTWFMVYSVLSIRHTLFSPYVLLCSLHIVYSVLSIWFTLFYYKRSWCHSFEIPLDYRCIDF
ncbi:unnamed protein product [Brassica napus]|uniref:(rape) hypothetical protein n=1 Tax=Brassica napus TaxID=3708 RepID=A0A816UTX7_BRANA|nr:unnamed protein product [Brassica napus]